MARVRKINESDLKCSTGLFGDRPHSGDCTSPARGRRRGDVATVGADAPFGPSGSGRSCAVPDDTGTRRAQHIKCSPRASSTSMAAACHHGDRRALAMRVAPAGGGWVARHPPATTEALCSTVAAVGQSSSRVAPTLFVARRRAMFAVGRPRIFRSTRAVELTASTMHVGWGSELHAEGDRGVHAPAWPSTFEAAGHEKGGRAVSRFLSPGHPSTFGAIDVFYLATSLGDRRKPTGRSVLIDVGVRFVVAMGASALLRHPKST